jgi:hypothetical protein
MNVSPDVNIHSKLYLIVSADTMIVYETLFVFSVRGTAEPCIAARHSVLQN